MGGTAEYPDVEVELIGWLGASVPGVVVVAELDHVLDGELPVVQVVRVAGDDDGFRLDRALVDVDVYAATRGGAAQCSAQVRSLLTRRLPGVATSRAVFGSVDTVSAPSWRPYENTALRRYGATYSIYLHPAA